MSQILILKKGDQVRTKETDLAELTEYKRLLAEAREAGTMDAETAALLEAIAQSSQNYQTADPLHNQNARWFQHSINKRMVDILNGEMGYDPLNTTVATANYFGRYTRPEIESITNDIVRKVRGQKKGNTPATTSATSAPVGTEGSAHHVYDWTGGRDYSILPANTSIKDRIGMFIEGLNKGISDAGAAHQAGKSIHRYDINKLAAALADLTELAALAGRLKEEGLTDEQAMDALTKIISKGNFQVDSDKFRNIFYKGSRSQSEGSVGSSYTSPIQAINDYAQQQGWKLIEKDGNTYAVNPATGQVVAGHGYIFNDFTSPYYKQGIFTDNSGRIHYGPLEGTGAVDRVALGDIYTNAIADAKERSKKQVVFHPYDASTMYNLVLDEIIEAGKKHPEAAQALTALLTNPQLAFADLSQHYDGNDYVFAIGNTREFDDADASPYGHNFTGKYIVRYNPNATKDEDKISFSLFQPEYYKSQGNLSERENQFAGVDKQSIYNLDALKDIVGLDYDAIKNIYQNASKYTKKDLYDYEGKDDKGSTAASRNLSNMVLWTLDNYNTADGKLFFKEFFNDDPRSFAVSLYKNWRAGKINLTPEIRDRILAIIVAESGKVESHKEGGVIKAERGTTVMKTPETKKEPAKKERESPSTDRDIAGNSTMWTGVDTARLVTTLADIAAAGVAFAPGAGTAASGVLSTGTTITDLVLDALDPAVSQSLMWKNLGTNTAIAAATLVGGGATKAAKITKNLVRLAPKVMAIYQFTDPEVRNVWLKVGKGEFEKLTRDEVRTLMYSLKAVAGGVQSVGATVNVSRRNVAPGTKTGNKVVKTSNKKTYILTPEEVKGIELAGKNGGKKAADKAFKDILKAKGVQQEEIKEAVLPELEQFGKEGTRWYKPWDWKKGLSLEDEVSGVSGYDKALQDYFKEDPYRHGYPVVGKEGSTKSVPDWLKWLPSDYLMANEGIHWRLPDIHITARGRYAAKASTPAQHDGGKLQRLEQFINNR